MLMNRGWHRGSQVSVVKRDHSPNESRLALARLDAWMSQSEWHPRIVPFFAWIVMMLVVSLATDLSLWLYVPLYAFQCALVLWLLWRYRKLTPELNLKFHWLAIPTAVFILMAWVGLGWLITGEFAVRWEALMNGQPIGGFEQLEDMGMEAGYFTTTQAHDLHEMAEQSSVLFWSSALLRLFGMAVVVALFEELFTRSLLLRAFHRTRPTMIGLIQVLEDLPLIGDWLIDTRASRRAAGKPFMWTVQLRATPVGAITVFSVAASTLVFTMNHLPRDWTACVLTGVVWCLLVWWTNRSRDEARRLGLGPVVWSHGLINAMLWGYCLWSGDMQFL